MWYIITYYISDAYDRQYSSAYESVRGLRGLYPTDQPLGIGAYFCRKFFRDLEL